MGQINALQRRVEVAQQGLALFEDETRGTGARLTEAFGRIEDVLREKDFQLVRREIELQRLTRENSQARMLLETLLETLEQRRLPSLQPIIEEFEKKLAASAALNGVGGPPSASGEEPDAAPEPEPVAQPVYATAMGGVASAVAYAPAFEATSAPASPLALVVSNPAVQPSDAQAPMTAFADPAGDMTVTVAAPQFVEPPMADPEPMEPEVLELTESSVYEPEAAVYEPAPPVFEPAPIAGGAAVDPNEELVAEARETLRARDGRGSSAAFLADEQRRYAYKIWLGPIMIGIGALGPLALVLARISH